MTQPLTRQPDKRVSAYRSLPGSEWINTNRASLPDNNWVAADGSGLLATDPSIDVLMNKLQNSQVNLDSVVISFITLESA